MHENCAVRVVRHVVDRAESGKPVRITERDIVVADRESRRGAGLEVNRGDRAGVEIRAPRNWPITRG